MIKQQRNVPETWDNTSKRQLFFEHKMGFGGVFFKKRYGPRYQDPKTSRWLSTDPALSSYLPTAGGDNSQLPGMGGIYNTVNMHLYHYSFNNPIIFTDPDGRTGSFPDGSPEQDAAWERSQAARQGIKFDDPLATMELTSDFGPRTDAKPPNHDGIDLRAKEGTPVYASEDGTVSMALIEPPKNISASESSNLRIDHGKGFESRYLHMDSFEVEAGDTVYKGQLIGFSGTRKNAEPHLHFEIRKDGVPRNPEVYLDKMPREKTLGPLNVYQRTR